MRRGFLPLGILGLSSAWLIPHQPMRLKHRFASPSSSSPPWSTPTYRSLNEVLSFHRRFTFGAWEDDDDVQLAMQLLRGSLLEENEEAKEEGIDEGSPNAMDSADPSFAELLSRLKDHAGFYDTTPWLWPPSTTTTDFDTTQALGAFVEDLESLTPVIQLELQDYLRESESESGGGGGGAAGAGAGSAWDGADYTQIAPDWSMLHLWRGGEWLADPDGGGVERGGSGGGGIAAAEEAARRFPRTVAGLRAALSRHGKWLNPLQQVACGIARQPAGTGIALHCDGNLLGETLHLGILVPSAAADEGASSATATEAEGEEDEADPSPLRCWIEVEGERRHWEEGRVLAMDTTFPHRTSNPFPPPPPERRDPRRRPLRADGQDRYVLMLQVLRPYVEPSHVRPVAHYLKAGGDGGRSGGGGGGLEQWTQRDVRILDPFPVVLTTTTTTTTATTTTTTTTAYPGRMLQRSPTDPRPPLFRPTTETTAEDASLVFRSAPSWDAPPIDQRRQQELPLSSSLEPCAFTLADDGGVSWIAVPAPRPASPSSSSSSSPSFPSAPKVKVKVVKKAAPPASFGPAEVRALATGKAKQLLLSGKVGARARGGGGGGGGGKGKPLPLRDTPPSLVRAHRAILEQALASHQQQQEQQPRPAPSEAEPPCVLWWLPVIDHREEADEEEEGPRELLEMVDDSSDK